MASINTPRSHSLPPLMLLHALLVLGLVGLAFAILSGNIILLVSIVVAPLLLLILGYGIYNPHFAYLLVGLYGCSFMTIGRYLYKDGLSVGVDILLLYWAATILIYYYINPSKINLRLSINPLTLSYIIWILFTIFQMLNPGTQSQGITYGLRTIILNSFVLYICTSILSNSPKILRYCLLFGGILTIIAFGKLLIQKYIGFDSAEKYFLYSSGGAATHLISTGARYFSIFSDAGNLGANGGLMATIYIIISLATSNWKWRTFYSIIGVLALLETFLSGTRSALIIPMVGLALYCLLGKQIKIFISASLFGLIVFVFFAYTNIGQGNEYIRRARTAFHPTEDASFNVRVRNRKEIAAFLSEHPMGAGIANEIEKLWFDDFSGTYVKGNLPPDSYYVAIWIQNGSIGLFIYIAMHAFWILSCCYIVLFRIKDKELRQQLAAFTCGVLGLMVAGYANDSIFQYPNNIITAVALAFVMNGPYIDRQLREQSTLPSISNNPKETSTI